MLEKTDYGSREGKMRQARDEYGNVIEYDEDFEMNCKEGGETKEWRWDAGMKIRGEEKAREREGGEKGGAQEGGGGGEQIILKKT